jgi:hypothetical protein
MSKHRDWGDTGRCAIASFEEVEEIVEKATAGGNTLGKEEMRRELAHRCPEASPPSDRTVSNYMTVGAASKRVRPTTHAIVKSNTRHTAENSIMSALSFAVTAGGTCFIPLVSADPSNKDAPPISHEDKRLSSMVARAFAAPVIPVMPSLLFSSDDTTVFACKGIANGNHEWRLASAGKSTLLSS